MAASIEGITISTSIEALASGEGFITRVNAGWNPRDTDSRTASRQAQTDGVIGSLLNGHEDTYVLAKDAVDARVAAFESEITTFISDWNAANP